MYPVYFKTSPGPTDQSCFILIMIHLISSALGEEYITFTVHPLSSDLCSFSSRTPRASSGSPSRSPRSPRGRPRWWLCTDPPARPPRRRSASSRTRSLRSPSRQTCQWTATKARARVRTSRRPSCKTRCHRCLYQVMQSRALGRYLLLSSKTSRSSSLRSGFDYNDPSINNADLP